MSGVLRQRPEDQPLPQDGRGPLSHDTVISQLRLRFNGDAVLEAMCADVRARQELGIRRYGKPLQAHNGRDSLLDLYEELLDGLAYSATAIEEDSASPSAAMVFIFDRLMDAARTVRELMSKRAARPSP